MRYSDDHGCHGARENSDTTSRSKLAYKPVHMRAELRVICRRVDGRCPILSPSVGIAKSEGGSSMWNVGKILSDVWNTNEFLVPSG